ncbi:pentapeptide repeat-containing protein [Alicyclobacillus curvatus]|nr:pentapeptide repeat-containing protein [Alicyclobacillus curvatus]
MGQPLSSDLNNSRKQLHADCEHCFALCCVALAFSASPDFAFDKDKGTPCRNLLPDFRCQIHHRLRQNEMRGCTVYECFGAGQKVSQVTFEGKDWRSDRDTADKMFKVFPIMQQLHEILWYLTEALSYKAALPIQDELRGALEKTEQFTLLDADSIMNLDIPAHRTEISSLLMRTSELVRAEADSRSEHPKQSKRSLESSRDLIGAKLRKADLRGASLKGAYLIAADLREADMRYSDCIGADFRDADLRGADLTGCIFLTQDQINSAKGNYRTKLPPSLAHPPHWSAY